MKNQTLPSIVVPQIIIDRTSPFYRECPCCGEEFMADHMHRKFCPEKFGVKDFCKTKFKQLKAEQQIIASSLYQIPFYKPPIPVPAQITPVAAIQQPIVIQPAEAPNQFLRSQIIERIIFLLNGKKYIESTPEVFENAGVDFTVYDQRIPLPKSNLFYTEIGDYAFFWMETNKILLTHQSEILWLSQR